MSTETSDVWQNTHSLDFWENLWTDGEAHWHNSEVHANMKKNLPAALKSTFGENVPTDLKVFVPLCGKSVDMMLFYSMGFSVVGVEFARQAAEEFFTENKLERADDGSGKVFSSKDGRMHIVCGDLYLSNASNLPYPNYDIIWDRGSYVAINLEDRSRYASLLVSLMSPKACLYMLDVYEYPIEEYGGPPMTVPKEEIDKYFNEWCSIEVLDVSDRISDDYPEESAFWKSHGITKMTQTLYSIKLNKPKQNYLSNGYWEQRWVDGKVGFHQAAGHPFLKKHLAAGLKSTFGEDVPTDLKVFVPLCGKAVDMMLFYSMGFSVVGVEFARQAAEEFFTENKLERADDGNSPIISSKDGKIQILIGDLFLYTPDKLPYPNYDVIWDRGSFVAINKEDRPRYATLLSSLMSSKACLYMMSSLDYPAHEYGGPPMSTPKEDVLSAFSPFCVLEEVERSDRMSEEFPEEQDKWKARGISRMTDTLYIIKAKQ